MDSYPICVKDMDLLSFEPYLKIHTLFNFLQLLLFSDDDKLHPIEAAPEKDEFDSNSKVREDEHAMDPLGSHEMNNASNHCETYTFNRGNEIFEVR